MLATLIFLVREIFGSRFSGIKLMERGVFPDFGERSGVLGACSFAKNTKGTDVSPSSFFISFSDPIAILNEGAKAVLAFIEVSMPPLRRMLPLLVASGDPRRVLPLLDPSGDPSNSVWLFMRDIPSGFL